MHAFKNCDADACICKMFMHLENVHVYKNLNACKFPKCLHMHAQFLNACTVYKCMHMHARFTSAFISVQNAKCMHVSQIHAYACTVLQCIHILQIHA
jgi:hypothetical protein